MITDKIFNPESKSIEYMNAELIEKCLTPVMKDSTFFNRHYSHATVEVRFSLVQKARELSDESLKQNR